MSAGQTPSQTVGPYFGIALGQPDENMLVADATIGTRVTLRGRVLDHDGIGIEDALIELWQANAVGRYCHPLDDRSDAPLDLSFTGFGRCPTRPDGWFEFQTVKPGVVPGPDGRLQAPHVTLMVQARGMLLPSFLRVYFGDEVAANSADPVLALVPTSRRSTLVAAVEADSTYRLDIRFGGDDETVFFEF